MNIFPVVTQPYIATHNSFSTHTSRKKFNFVKMKLLLVHIFAIVHYVFSLWYDQMYVDIPSKVKPENRINFFKGRLIYLTLWNMLIQTLFYVICVINDVAGTNEINVKRKPMIRRIKDMLITCIAYPLAMFVGLTFWGLYAVDRELVFPKSIDPFFPTWLNHVMHTNIMVFILIEMAATYRPYPDRKKGLTILISFMVCYLIWMHIVYYKTGVWVYPVMEVLNLPLRICFFIGLLGLATIIYCSGEYINDKLWSKHLSKRPVKCN